LKVDITHLANRYAGDLMRSPLVSVLIAAYGRADYLNQALKSVLDQTFDDYEIIVVDDCSPEEVVHAYELPESATLIRLEKHHGLACPGRNVGIRAARGKYIAFLDVDDIWLPDKLETQVRALEQAPDAGLAYCHYIKVDDSLDADPDQRRVLPARDGYARGMIVRNLIGAPSCVLARRDVLIECGLFDESLVSCSDWDMWMRIAARYPLLSDPEPRVLYRSHPGQLSRRRLQRRTAHVQIHDKAMDWIGSCRPDLRNLVRRSLCRSLRKLAEFQMHCTDDWSQVISLLCRARRIWPWTPATYVLIVEFVFRSLRFQARRRPSADSGGTQCR